jgi:hypothetical protein
MDSWTDRPLDGYESDPDFNSNTCLTVEERQAAEAAGMTPEDYAYWRDCEPLVVESEQSRRQDLTDYNDWRHEAYQAQPHAADGESLDELVLLSSFCHERGQSAAEMNRAERADVIERQQARRAKLSPVEESHRRLEALERIHEPRPITQIIGGVKCATVDSRRWGAGRRRANIEHAAWLVRRAREGVSPSYIRCSGQRSRGAGRPGGGAHRRVSRGAKGRSADDSGESGEPEPGEPAWRASDDDVGHRALWGAGR